MYLLHFEQTHFTQSVQLASKFSFKVVAVAESRFAVCSTFALQFNSEYFQTLVLFVNSKYKRRMPNGHLEAGDHQSTFSSTFFPFDSSFLSFPVDAADAPQFPNGAYLTNDDSRTFYNSTPSEYQPIPSPEINAQYLKELENDKWFLLSLMQALSPPCFYHATKVSYIYVTRLRKKTNNKTSCKFCSFSMKLLQLLTCLDESK